MLDGVFRKQSGHNEGWLHVLRKSGSRILGGERGLPLMYLGSLRIHSAFAKKDFGTRADSSLSKPCNRPNL